METVEVWKRCACDQFGRCLADCPSADRTDRPGAGWYWDRRGRRWVSDMSPYIISTPEPVESVHLGAEVKP